MNKQHRPTRLSPEAEEFARCAYFRVKPPTLIQWRVLDSLIRLTVIGFGHISAVHVQFGNGSGTPAIATVRRALRYWQRAGIVWVQEVGGIGGYRYGIVTTRRGRR